MIQRRGVSYWRQVASAHVPHLLHHHHINTSSTTPHHQYDESATRRHWPWHTGVSNHRTVAHEDQEVPHRINIGMRRLALKWLKEPRYLRYCAGLAWLRPSTVARGGLEGRHDERCPAAPRVWPRPSMGETRGLGCLCIWLLQSYDGNTEIVRTWKSCAVDASRKSSVPCAEGYRPTGGPSYNVLRCTVPAGESDGPYHLVQQGTTKWPSTYALARTYCCRLVHGPRHH
jgi:hypothetical protein